MRVLLFVSFLNTRRSALNRMPTVLSGPNKRLATKPPARYSEENMAQDTFENGDRGEPPDINPAA